MRAVVIYLLLGLMALAARSEHFAGSYPEQPEEPVYFIGPCNLPDSLLPALVVAPAVVSSNEYFGSSHLLTATELIPRHIEAENHNQWISWVMIFSLASLAMGRFLFPSRMEQSFKAIIGIRYFNQMEREGNLFNESLSYLLLFNYLAIMALLILQTLSAYGASAGIITHWQPVWLYLLVFGLLACYYAVKGIFTGFIAWVFRTHHANRNYLKNIHLFNHLTGIVLLPLVIFSAYNASQRGILLAWIVVLMIGLLKVRRNMIIGHKQAGFSAYYIILYLCAIELAPLLVLLKAASRL